MLINLSNHSSLNWEETQLKAAESYGNIFDLEFPALDPDASCYEVTDTARDYAARISAILDQHPAEKNAVHLMGEITFCYTLATILQKKRVTCIASTTGRWTTEIGRFKTSEFRFRQFREYPDFNTL